MTGDVFRIPKDGSPRTKLGHTTQPIQFAIDATTVFWTDIKEHRVYSLPLSGGVPTAITPTLPYVPAAIAVDTTTLYMTSDDGDVVVAMDKDGSNARTLATDQLNGTEALAVNSRFVYWSAGVRTGIGTIWRVAK